MKLQRDLLSLTTLPGFSHSVVRGGKRKVVYLLLAALALSYTFHQVKNVLLRLKEGETLTRSSLEPQKPLEFPRVSVCHFNKVNCRNIDITLGYKVVPSFPRDLEEYPWTPESGERREELTEEVVRRVCAIRKLAGCRAPMPEGSPCRMVDTSAVDSVSTDDMEDVFQDQLLALTSIIREWISLWPQQFVKSCSFGLSDCYLFEGNTDLLPYYNNNVGPCVLFNSNARWNSTEPGQVQGLEVVVQQDLTDFIKTGITGWKSMVSVNIFPPGHFPSQINSVYDVAPNTAAFFSMRETEMTFLPYPAPSACIGSWDEVMGGSLGVLNFTRDKVPYSELQCLNFCQIYKIYQKCGRCFSSWYDSLQFKEVFEKAVGWRIGKIPYCSLTNSTVIKCMTENRLNHVKVRSTCGCNTSCSELRYDVELSTAHWPADRDWRFHGFKYNVPAILENLAGENKKKAVLGSLSKIKVYYRSGYRRLVSEVERFPNWYSRMSAFGAAMTLAMGFSFIHVLEFFEMAAEALAKMV